MSTRRPLASTKEVAAYLGIPVGTLHNWRSQHQGPRAAKVGRSLRYRWEDVEAWLDAQSRTAGAA
jgi:excisionase family DNA binding protein